MTLADHIHPSLPPKRPHRPTSPIDPTPHTRAPSDEPRRKPPTDVSDLLIMGSFDQKTPAPAFTGLDRGVADDLLDAMVQDDLARADATPTPAPLEPESLAREDPAPRPAIDRTHMLQREIEMLLGESAQAAPPPPADPEPVALVEPVPSEPEPEPEPVADVTVADDALSAAEVHTLIPPTTEEPPAPEPLPFAPYAMPESDDDTARQLSEAEGVLAAELAQLMADGQTAAPVAEPVPEPPPAVIAEVPATVVATEPVPIAVEVVPAEAAAPAGSLFARLRNFTSDLALMTAQLVDVPFSWIDELDKNVIGVAALLLLLSGVVMYLLAWVYR